MIIGFACFTDVHVCTAILTFSFQLLRFCLICGCYNSMTITLTVRVGHLQTFCDPYRMNVLFLLSFRACSDIRVRTEESEAGKPLVVQ